MKEPGILEMKDRGSKNKSAFCANAKNSRFTARQNGARRAAALGEKRRHCYRRDNTDFFK